MFSAKNRKENTLKVDEISVRKMYLIRSKLLNFINNAHNLICDQIFELSNAFLRKIKTQTDIDEIIELHANFLQMLVKNCLLKNRFFQSSFLKILNLILEFCDVWRKGVFYFVNEQAKEFVQDMDKSIKQHFEFIHKFLSTFINRNHSTYFQSLIAVL